MLKITIRKHQSLQSLIILLAHFNLFCTNFIQGTSGVSNLSYKCYVTVAYILDGVLCVVLLHNLFSFH